MAGKTGEGGSNASTRKESKNIIRQRGLVIEWEGFSSKGWGEGEVGSLTNRNRQGEPGGTLTEKGGGLPGKRENFVYREPEDGDQKRPGQRGGKRKEKKEKKKGTRHETKRKKGGNPPTHTERT